MSRIVIHDPREFHEEWPDLLSGNGREIVLCRNREMLVTVLGERRPDVLIYVLSDLARDLRLLFDLRHFAATLPIVLLEGPADLDNRRRIQELNPIYYGIAPIEDSEVSEVVRGALGRGR